MRITVQLDPEVHRQIKELARRRGTSFNAVFDEVLRRGLPPKAIEEPVTRFVVEPHDSLFLAGIDVEKLNDLDGLLEIEDFLNEMAVKGR